MRHHFAFAGLLLLSCAPALAEPTRDEVMSGADRCAGIADNRVWLDCFYGSAQPMRSVLGLSPASPAQTKLVPPPGAAYAGRPLAATSRAEAPPPEESSSFLRALLGSTKPLIANMPMADYQFVRGGGFVITLQDGHVWAEDESDTAIAHWKKPAPTYLVNIRKGALDSFNMGVKGEGAVYKVHKVR